MNFHVYGIKYALILDKFVIFESAKVSLKLIYVD